MKQKKFFLLIALALIAVMLIGVMAACSGNKNNGEDNYTGANTLVVGYSYFSNKFSPFFSKTAYDQDVAAMTQLGLLTSDRQGNIIKNGIEGETISYNGTPYTYTGIADVDITMPTDTDTNVYYDITIRDDIKFSDGVAMTIDDVIFNYYVLSDPNYDGSSTFYAQPVKGLSEYRAGVKADIYEKYSGLADDIAAAGFGVTDFSATSFTEAQYNSYWNDCLNQAGIPFTTEIYDYVMSKYLKDDYVQTYFSPDYTTVDLIQNEGIAVAYSMAMWGYGGFGFHYEVGTDDTANRYFVEDAEGAYALIDGNFTTYGIPDDYSGQYYTRHKLVMENDGTVAAEYTADAAGTYYLVDGTYTTVDPTDYTGDMYIRTVYTGTRYKAVDDTVFYDLLGQGYDLVNTYPTIQIYWENILGNFGKDLSNSGINYESAGTDIKDFVKTYFIAEEGPKDPQSGGAITSIEGIEKTGDYSMKITMTKFDATSIYQLAISVAPMHYYGSTALYDYANDKFGFVKGDLSSVKAKTTTPMGAGAYKFVNFENGVVTFERNTNFYKGTPKITYILFKETADADKVPGVQGTTFDVSDPSFNSEAADAVRSANSNGQLTGDTISTSLVDNLGYGYIGISAKNVCVNDDIDSEASKDLRKAFATMFAAYRETAINSYYGDLASVIQYPISNTSWAAPQAADEGYEIAYSTDVDGNPIYTASMSDTEKFAAAKAAAIGFFKAAGYTFDTATGKFTAAPTGASLDYEVIVPGDGTGDHPAFAILNWAKSQLATIGITLNINDPADSNELWTALESGVGQMWAAAWGATVDPDMYQVYYSTNVVGGGGTESNHYYIQSDELDDLIMEARVSADTSFRKATYKSCLEIILDWGVEVPNYQRKNAIIFNTSRIDMSTVTPDITTFWGWMNDIEELEMN